MQGLKAELLRGLWYVALAGRDLRRGRTGGEDGAGRASPSSERTRRARVRAARHLRPSRHPAALWPTSTARPSPAAITAGASTSAGTCVEIPSLREGQQIDLGKIRCGAYPCLERQGLVWIYFPRQERAAPVPSRSRRACPVFADEDQPEAAIMQPFPCSTDHAAFGLMDPTHAAFVHTSWWFKHQARKLRPKEKQFEPIELGCRMVRHPLPPQNLIYRLLGHNVETEISYRLPGLRIEEVHGDRTRWSG